jgi:hypothetical protein
VIKSEGPFVSDLLDLLADVAAKATPYGEQDGGFVAMYLLPTGPVHRILATLGEYGRPVPIPPPKQEAAE